MADLEKNKGVSLVESIHSESFEEQEAILDHYQPVDTDRLPKWIRWAYQLDKLGVEAHGIERIPPEERTGSWPKMLFAVFWAWFAGSGGLTNMLLFYLCAYIFHLNLRNALVSGILLVFFGSLIPAYCATMGPQLGCRQIVGSRLIFGHYVIRFVAFLVIVGALGWNIVNSVLGGQVLAAVGQKDNIPLAAGIVIVAGGLFLISFFGIDALLMFQMIAAIPVFIVVILLYVCQCKKLEWVLVTNQAMLEQYSTETTTGNWLSFFAIGYLVSSTWGPIASDYYHTFPENTLLPAVFLTTFAAIFLSTTFVAVAAIIGGTISYSYPPWDKAYNDFGIGGIINEAFSVWGKFGQFLLVVLFLSLICNSVMLTYLISFNFQLLHWRCARVPRWIWAGVAAIVYLIISLVTRDEGSLVILAILPILAYWISMYFTLLLEENILFRTPAWGRRWHQKEFEGMQTYQHGRFRYLYNWAAVFVPHRIPIGVAAIALFLIGVVGSVIGMNQIFWQGWCARLIGEDGGDLGLWMSGGFTGVVYPFLRYAELKYLER